MLYFQCIANNLNSYKQAAGIEVSKDRSGQKVLVNRQAPTKILTQMCTINCESIPQAYDPGLEPVESLTLEIQNLVKFLQDLLEQRPIWTRRSILNHRAIKQWAHALKFAVQYCGYMFRSGPYRDAVVKFGIDPRKDPKYRKYQTVFFQIGKNDEKEGEIWEDMRTKYSKQSREKDYTSHVFDGKKVTPDGKAWQLCDITDPILLPIINTENIRPDFDDFDGWYLNGTMAKLKIIMKHKIKMILRGSIPNDLVFETLTGFPDYLDSKNADQAHYGRTASRQPAKRMLESMDEQFQQKLFAEYRASAIKTPSRSAPKAYLNGAPPNFHLYPKKVRASARKMRSRKAKNEVKAGTIEALEAITLENGTNVSIRSGPHPEGSQPDNGGERSEVDQRVAEMMLELGKTQEGDETPVGDLDQQDDEDSDMDDDLDHDMYDVDNRWDDDEENVMLGGSDDEEIEDVDE
jgi:RNA polymerase III transcription factor (TF)IIIC subunit HTH domain